MFLKKRNKKKNHIKTEEISLSRCSKANKGIRKFDDFVSVIINVHNGEDFINEAISNVLLQTHKNIIIIIYDNCSSDLTPNICRKFGKKINYYRSEEFLSLPEARNNAICLSDTEYIAFLDVDDLWCKDKIAIQLANAKKKKNFCMSFTNSFTLSNGHMKRNSPVVDFGHKANTINQEIFLSNPIIFSSIFLSKDAYESVGRFSINLKSSIDYDLYLRFAIVEGLDYVPDYLTIYRIHSNNLSKIQNIEACRDNISILRKYVKSHDVKLNLQRNICLYNFLKNRSQGRLDRLLIDFIKSPYCFFHIFAITIAKVVEKFRGNYL